MDTISMEEALEVINSGAIVSLKYVSFDKKRKTGGSVKTIEQAVVTNPKTAKPVSAARDSVKNKKSTNPNNMEHSTRNFYMCSNGQPTSSIRKVHWVLILELNGKKVML